MLPMVNLVLGIFFISISTYFIWVGKESSNSLIKKWGSLKSKHITKTDKESIKNSGGTLEMGFLGLFIGIVLLVQYFSSL